MVGGKHHIESVFVLNVGKVLGESVGVRDVGCLNAVQNQIHEAIT